MNKRSIWQLSSGSWRFLWLSIISYHPDQKVYKHEFKKRLHRDELILKMHIFQLLGVAVM